MSYTQITARITDQSIQLVSIPTLASGSAGVLQVNCQFDSLWDGYGKTAVFYKDKEKVFHAPMVEDVATIPAEVLATEGRFYFGVFGVADNTRTTEMAALDLKQGAITVPTDVPSEPTPDLYTLLLRNMGKVEQLIKTERARVDQLVAMRNTDGLEEYYIGDSYIHGTIVSNGVNAYADLTIEGLSLVGGGYHYTDYYIGAENFIPLTDVELRTSNPDINVTLLKDVEAGMIRILVENVSSEMYTTDEVTFARATYPLNYVTIPELADIRITSKGEQYGAAGDAVRDQFDSLQTEVDELNDKVISGEGGGSLALDATLTKAGRAADAKAVGDRFGDIEVALDELHAYAESLKGGASV